MSENLVLNAEVVSGSQLTKTEEVSDKLAWLSDPERYALEYFRKSFQKGGASTYAIAPSTQAQLFALYLNGRTLNEIRILNHPNFNLGQIVAAAVDNNWEEQKKEYVSGLMQKAKARLQQVGCEAVSFLSDQLSAAHKMHGEAIAKYLQSGNPADLGSFGVMSLKQYKDVLELLLKATGQDKTATTNLNVKGMVEHVAAEAAVSGTKSLAELAAAKKEKDLALIQREEELGKKKRVVE